MTTTKTPAAVGGREGALRAFVREGCSGARPRSNAAGDVYGPHDHGYHKVLFCLEGSIRFHMDDGDEELSAGDRLDIEPGTEHAATVGPDGCSCIEASR